jgi:hypothetical protein
MDANPPTAADYAWSEANEASSNLAALTLRLAALAHRVETLETMLAALIARLPNP